MKITRYYLLLAVCWLAFACYVNFTASQLPVRVATHFGANGAPNGWMPRAAHVRFTLFFGALIPAFIVGLFAWIRSRDGWGLNIPHKDYWLAPERRQATFDFIQRQGLVFAGMFIVFLGAVHHSIVAANARQPISLSTDAAWIGGIFIGAVVVWAAIFIGRFYRKVA